MNRELWLLRHAKSDWDVDVPDLQRPLKKRGRKAAQKIGVWMKQQEIIPDWIISSPAERALATIARVCEELEMGMDSVYRDERVYAASVDSLLTVLSECPKESKRVLLVGHNPELERILIEMVGIDNLPYKKKLMPTATLAGMSMPDDWSRLQQGCARLMEITYAKSLLDDS
jgi:phosphohistidine phosphatase